MLSELKPVYLEVNYPIEEKIELCHAQLRFSSKGTPRLVISKTWTSDRSRDVHDKALFDERSGAQNDSCSAFPVLTILNRS